MELSPYNFVMQFVSLQIDVDDSGKTCHSSILHLHIEIDIVQFMYFKHLFSKSVTFINIIKKAVIVA